MADIVKENKHTRKGKPMTEVPFAHNDDYIINDISLAEQDAIVHDNNFEFADLIIEGVLNDTTVYVLPDNFTADDGNTYDFLVLGHTYATPNSNTLYAHYTNHQDVYEKWAEIQDEQHKEN